MRGFRVVVAINICCCLLFTLASSRARADGGATEANVSTYVSDEFKTVAKKLAKQYIGDELKKACPAGSLVCTSVVDRLVDALDSVIDGDTSRLRADLNTFFVESAIAGGVAVLISQFVDVPALTKKVESNPTIEKLRPLLTPLGVCLVALVKDGRQPCTLAKDLEQKLIDLAIAPIGNDAEHVNNLLDEIKNGKPIDRDDLIITLEAIASSPTVNRQDLRSYLTALKTAVDKGLEGGLFEFTIAFFDGVDTETSDLRAGTAIALFSPDYQAGFEKAFTDCKVADAWKAWSTGLAEREAEIRRDLQLDHDIPQHVRDELDAAIGATCAANTKELEQFHRFALFLRGSLGLYQFRRNYRIIVPAIALVLDLVRTGDQDQFDQHTRVLIGRMLTSFRICDLIEDESVCVDAAKNNVTLCQPAFVAAALTERDPTLVGQCLDLNSRATCSTLKAGKAPKDFNQGTGGKCYFPELELLSTDSIAERRKATADLASTYALPKLKKDLASNPKLFEALERAVAAYGDNDLKTTRKILARAGVELLLDHVEKRLYAELGADACENSPRVGSIFRSLDAKCALAVLIEAAYYPIADFIWDGGIDAKNASQVADSAYSSILKSKYLAGSPIILDVGLGASSVWGFTNDSVFGMGSYHAFTVIDKFGLALIKYNGDNVAFQAGPFVGGFLDSLVRAVDGDKRTFWLAGLTLGFPRVYSDFGLEFHAAVAMPYGLDSFKSESGFDLGAVVVIPWDFWTKEK